VSGGAKGRLQISLEIGLYLKARCGGCCLRRFAHG